jgi:hypothetical protein
VNIPTAPLSVPRWVCFVPAAFLGCVILSATPGHGQSTPTLTADIVKMSEVVKALKPYRMSDAASGAR